eukprot:Platyproteum_vivax@DN820_c0_g1_i1.p2
MPMYPLRGYSYTLDVPQLDIDEAKEIIKADLEGVEQAKLLIDLLKTDRFCIEDEFSNVRVTKISPTRFRITGVGEWGGWHPDCSFRTSILLKQKAIQLVPQLEKYITHATPRVGFRPLTPSNFPYVGQLWPYQNVYVHGGHGCDGYRTAPLTAYILGHEIEGTLDQVPDSLHDFGRVFSQDKEKKHDAATENKPDYTTWECILAMDPTRKSVGGAVRVARNIGEYVGQFMMTTRQYYKDTFHVRDSFKPSEY